LAYIRKAVSELGIEEITYGQQVLLFVENKMNKLKQSTHDNKTIGMIFT